VFHATKKLQFYNQVVAVLNVLKIQLLSLHLIYVTVPNKDISGSLKPTNVNSHLVHNIISSKMMDQEVLSSKNVLPTLLPTPLILLVIVSMLMLLSLDFLVKSYHLNKS